MGGKNAFRFGALFAELLVSYSCSANLVSDAYLAALAREHGLTVVSADAAMMFPHSAVSSPKKA